MDLEEVIGALYDIESHNFSTVGGRRVRFLMGFSLYNFSTRLQRRTNLLHLKME